MKDVNAKNCRALIRRPERQGLTAQATQKYVRRRDLPSLIAVWPGEIADYSQAGTHYLIGKLKSALRAERQRGREGHWSYDLERHMGLVNALKAEILVCTDSHPPGPSSPASRIKVEAQTHPRETLHTKPRVQK